MVLDDEESDVPMEVDTENNVIDLEDDAKEHERLPTKKRGRATSESRPKSPLRKANATQKPPAAAASKKKKTDWIPVRQPKLNFGRSQGASAPIPQDDEEEQETGFNPAPSTTARSNPFKSRRQ